MAAVKGLSKKHCKAENITFWAKGFAENACSVVQTMGFPSPLRRFPSERDLFLGLMMMNFCEWKLYLLLAEQKYADDYD